MKELPHSLAWIFACIFLLSFLESEAITSDEMIHDDFTVLFHVKWQSTDDPKSVIEFNRSFLDGLFDLTEETAPDHFFREH